MGRKQLGRVAEVPNGKGGHVEMDRFRSAASPHTSISWDKMLRAEIPERKPSPDAQQPSGGRRILGVVPGGVS
ncbi:Hypothetical protein SMAX5B_016189 [Scophthalmus maximus]|uniref:Uncharacterized protein n=1 Tax=Scophthalmus maximus TaxID=52904 RepID=A0A2U9BL44_SCOMX|nr:Hypothetical protein SMAX5B_016189 [Scophthalmus maximus]